MDMHLKIGKKSLSFSLLMMCITAVYGANYWFSNIYTNDFMVLSALILSVIIFLIFGCRIIRSEFRAAIALNLVMWVAGIIRAMGYGLPFTIILKESCYSIVPLLIYFAFRPLIKSVKDLNGFLHIVLWAGIICNIVAIVEMFFALRGIDILRMNVFSKLRNGTPRFTIGETVIVISFLLSVSILLDKDIPRNRKGIYYINIALTLINLLWIIKTRTLDLYLLATVLMIPVLNKRAKKRIRVLLGFVVVGILAFVLLSDFIPALNTLIDNDYGIQMRFYMINYYLDYFKSHWLFGAGYISSNPYYSTYSIVAGPFGRYYTSDVGVIGLMFRSGIIGIAWLVSWFLGGIKTVKRSHNNVPTYYDMLIKLFLLFLLFSCINLILTDAPRFPYIALGMLLFESVNLFSVQNTQPSAINQNKEGNR